MSFIEMKRNRFLLLGVCFGGLLLIGKQDGKYTYKGQWLNSNMSWPLVNENMKVTTDPPQFVSYHVNETNSSDVLLLTYMCGGSSYAGKVLGWRNDSFYWFEPLWEMTFWGYFRGDDMWCDIRYGNCKQTNPVIRQDAYNILDRVYKCNIDGTCLNNLQHGTATMNFSGPSWLPYTRCTKHTREKYCPRVLQDMCKNQRHRVTKIQRATPDFLARLLTEHPRLKIVHLVRDPRAIINSMKISDWYQFLDKNSSIFHIGVISKGLCSKLKHDIAASSYLASQYPDRVKIIHYEHLVLKGAETVHCLNRFLGMKPVNVVTAHAEKAFKWRYVSSGGLSLEQIKTVDQWCSDTYKALGYKSGSELVNLDNRSLLDQLKYRCA